MTILEGRAFWSARCEISPWQTATAGIVVASQVMLQYFSVITKQQLNSEEYSRPGEMPTTASKKSRYCDNEALTQSQEKRHSFVKLTPKVGSLPTLKGFQPLKDKPNPQFKNRRAREEVTAMSVIDCL
ncbi:hypothetical protein DFH28DRAFT_921189 [Melampsora americana]|nr:hypothetical protein DFH28DRAFT_921189 [Melampsora americana]